MTQDMMDSGSGGGDLSVVGPNDLDIDVFSTTEPPNSPNLPSVDRFDPKSPKFEPPPDYGLEKHGTISSHKNDGTFSTISDIETSITKIGQAVMPFFGSKNERRGGNKQRALTLNQQLQDLVKTKQLVSQLQSAGGTPSAARTSSGDWFGPNTNMILLAGVGAVVLLVILIKR